MTSRFTLWVSLLVSFSLACGCSESSQNVGSSAGGLGSSTGGTSSMGGTPSGSGGASMAGTSATGGANNGGELWGGILDPSRAIDWTHAGVVGGIPNRTTACATLNPGATAAQINAVIKACPADQVVMLTAGTYNISDDGIVMKTGVTLRGAGADQTLLVFTATNYCNNPRKLASALPGPTNGAGTRAPSPAARTTRIGRVATRRGQARSRLRTWAVRR